MNPLAPLIARAEGALNERAPALSLRLPDGQRLGAGEARVELVIADWSALAHVAAGRIGALAEDIVEGRITVHGVMRDVMTAAGQLAGRAPTAAAGMRRGWRALFGSVADRARHTPEADARQVQFHYDVSDDFYALWLDPRRVYSCAYWREGAATLAAAQEAKLDHICRKLMLREGERFLDVGAGWGGLLLWAAEHYGVRATGITLSKHQHAFVTRLIDERGLGHRVRMHLLDYRALPEGEPFDKIASVGMFEHVGRAQLEDYFAKLLRLLAPGGLLLNHGITAGATGHRQLGAGIGDFVERYIFPGGELVHVSLVLAAMSDAGWEALDVENLRPHYAKTLWAWSDALESRLDAAERCTDARIVRAYRLYLAGSAMAFERGWMALHQVLAARSGAQSPFPFTRDYIYKA
jgi:cyclopropane-fatty-acyl-phospholipid synthase